MPGWGSYSFQSSHSPIMVLAQSFHDYTLLILIVILLLIMAVMVDILTSTSPTGAFVDHSLMEIWWTTLPGVVLVFIAYPSLRLLYLMDEVESTGLTVNTLGHQWFWEYNLPNYPGLSFESYMTSSSDQLRLLEVDNRLTLPSEVLTRMVISSTDVLHSWAVPSLGLKVDAIPGRLNQLGLESCTTGLMYGQCSEVCGANHSFMPIVVESLPLNKWVSWVRAFN